MSDFGDAFRFIAHNGAVSGNPGLPSLVHLSLETLKVGAIGVAIALVLAAPLGIWLGHIHRGSFFAINVGNLSSFGRDAAGELYATSLSGTVYKITG